MSWTKERDLLISQTMAFVKSIAPNSETDARAKSRPEFPAMPRVAKETPAAKVETVERLVEGNQMTRPLPLPRLGMREEIQGRVAAFRAHQQVFHRERDAYFHAVLDKARASTGRSSKPAGN